MDRIDVIERLENVQGNLESVIADFEKHRIITAFANLGCICENVNQMIWDLKKLEGDEVNDK